MPDAGPNPIRLRQTSSVAVFSVLRFPFLCDVEKGIGEPLVSELVAEHHSLREGDCGLAGFEGPLADLRRPVSERYDNLAGPFSVLEVHADVHGWERIGWEEALSSPKALLGLTQNGVHKRTLEIESSRIKIVVIRSEVGIPGSNW